MRLQVYADRIHENRTALPIVAVLACLLGCNARVKTIDISVSPDAAKTFHLLLRSTPMDEPRLVVRVSSPEHSKFISADEIAKAPEQDGLVQPWEMGACFSQVYWPSNDIVVALVKNCFGLLNWIAYDFRQQRLVSTVPYHAGIAAAITKDYGLNAEADAIAWVKSTEVREAYYYKVAIHKGGAWVPE